MKYSKRYIAFTGVLAVALLIKFNNFGEQYQTVNRFRGAQLEEETWNPLIAQSVNEGLLSVVIAIKNTRMRSISFRGFESGHHGSGLYFTGCIKLQRTYL